MFWDYLKSRLKVLILLIVVEGIFVSSYFLFDLPAACVRAMETLARSWSY